MIFPLSLIFKLDLVLTSTSYDNIGPTFSLEPPPRFDFTHTLGARLDCVASGIPTPNIEWFDSENNPVNSISSVSSLGDWKYWKLIEFLFTDSSHFSQRLPLLSPIPRRELSPGCSLDNLQVRSCKFGRNNNLERCAR